MTAPSESNTRPLMVAGEAAIATEEHMMTAMIVIEYFSHFNRIDSSSRNSGKVPNRIVFGLAGYLRPDQNQ
jgi:hypothetical protein